MLSESRKKSLGQAAQMFHESLDDPAWAYLLEERGLSEEQVVQYRLGLVSNPSPTYEPYAGRLAIPFITPTGVVAIRFRCIVDHDCKQVDEETGFHKKYLQQKGEGDRLYNVGALHERHPAIAISEGEIDAMIVDTHVLPCVGIAGAHKWKGNPHWRRLFEAHEKVFVIGDGDEAGRGFVDKLTEALPNAQGVILPTDEDANSFFLKEGAEALSDFILGGS